MDSIPIGEFGKDHWSTFAYAETIMVDTNKKFVIQFDQRMRQKRRNFRVFWEAALEDGRRKDTNRGIPMEPKDGTILRDNTVLPKHDDWDCVLDLIKAGLMTCKDRTPDFDGDWFGLCDGDKIVMTDRGYEVLGELRRYKCEGGNFSSFVPGKKTEERDGNGTVRSDTEAVGAV